MIGRSAVTFACLLVGLVAAASAQQPTGRPVTPPAAPPSDTTEQGDVVEQLSVATGPAWRTSYFPYFTGGGGEGVLLAGRVRYFQPAAYDDRVTYRGAVQVDAGIGLKHSRFATLVFQAPLLAKEWRLVAGLAAAQEGRQAFFGLGNASTFDESVESDPNPDFYRVRRTHYDAALDLTRHVAGPLSVALLGAAQSVTFTGTDRGTSVFRQEVGDRLHQTDVVGRLALVLDTRDNEYNPTRGVLAQGGVLAGTGGDGYHGLYAMATGYLPLREATFLAARVGGQNLDGGVPLNARYNLLEWEGPRTGLYGGYNLNRGYGRGRYLGTGTLFGNVELRHDVFSFGDIGFLTVLGFLDGGRVFENESWRLTLDDWHLGYGGGLAVRLLRSTVFTGTVANGDDGVRFDVGSGWSF